MAKAQKKSVLKKDSPDPKQPEKKEKSLDNSFKSGDYKSLCEHIIHDIKLKAKDQEGRWDDWVTELKGQFKQVGGK